MNNGLGVNKNKYAKKIIIGLICFVSGVILFVSLVKFEKKSLEEYRTCDVLVAKKDIESGEIINSADVDEYFKETKASKDCAVKGLKSISDLKRICDKKGSLLVVNSIKSKEMIYEEKFICIEKEVQKYNQPIVAGVKLNSYEYCVGGKLRSGDIVDLTILNLDNSEEICIENVLVLKSFDVNGVEITSDNKEAVSVGFNLVFEKELYDMYGYALENGTIKLTRKITG